MQAIIHTGASSVSVWVPAATIVAALVAAIVALSIHKQTIRLRIVTEERAAWRSELRKEMAALSAAVLSATVENGIRIAAFERARVGIWLRVNPLGRMGTASEKIEHGLDASIQYQLSCLSNISRMSLTILNQPQTRKNIRRIVHRLEDLIQELIKQEWDKSKTEAGFKKSTSALK